MQNYLPGFQSVPSFDSFDASQLLRRSSALKPPVQRLYVRGNLAEGLDRPRVGVIGSRTADPDTQNWTRSLAGQLAARGAVVVSGGARGIDGQAHWGAIDCLGVTWWVSGTAVDKVYPAEHRSLLREILAGRGALISEIGPGGRSGRYLFRLRNRLIAALVDALVVVAAGPRSGSLSTVSYALEQGCPVYVPAQGVVPETAGIAELRDHPKIIALSRENLFTELSKRGGDCIAPRRS